MFKLFSHKDAKSGVPRVTPWGDTFVCLVQPVTQPVTFFCSFFYYFIFIFLTINGNKSKKDTHRTALKVTGDGW
jgi:hypothetical protein